MHVVTHKHDGAAVVLERADQCVDTRHVEVRRRLIEQDEVGRCEQQFNQCKAAFFAATEHFDALVHIVAAEQEGPEQVAYVLAIHTGPDLVHGFVEHSAIEVEYIDALL